MRRLPKVCRDERGRSAHQQAVALHPTLRRRQGGAPAARSAKLREVPAGEDILREGEPNTHITIVVSGWAWRYKQLEDGRRPATSLFLPDDICDLYGFMLREADHFIGALTDVTVACVSRELFDEVTLDRPRMLQSLLWDALVQNAAQREWTLSVGQRSAYERVAHLLCETFIRLRAAGCLHDGTSSEWPLRQRQLADATGLSVVHVNRTIMDLRKDGLIDIRGRILTIPNLDALMSAAIIDVRNLHLDHEGRHLDPMNEDHEASRRTHGRRKPA